MNIKLLLSLAALTTLSLAAQEPVQTAAAEPTNEQIIAFLAATDDLAGRIEAIDIHFTLNKGESTDAIWKDVVQKTTDYIIVCLKNDDQSLEKFAPFVHALCTAAKKEHGLHGNITIDFNDGQQADVEEVEGQDQATVTASN